MGIPIALGAAVARTAADRRAADDERRLRRLQDDPAWIADETDPDVTRTLRRMRTGTLRDPAVEARRERALGRAMLTILAVCIAGVGFTIWMFATGHA